MALRFSEFGPAFPTPLVDDLLLGEAIFVCGAGVSAPQLPGFSALVGDVFERCGLEPDSGEQRAIQHGRFEEALGSLARRLVQPRRLYSAVDAALAVPAGIDLSHHEILLRLSRDRDNRHSLVTTNFDLLFEHAIAGHEGSSRAASASVAGQALPAPGAEDFAGIVHLHGRLADPVLELDATPLVLTSAEYGDAYMRSGWASRFLFDLARCKTIVLVGYSANDAPVRYFLNILAADRDRFPDLRQVYALDSYTDEAREVDANWSTVAVEPIPYRKSEAGLADHAGLWRDLGKLADLADRPRRTRRAMIGEVLRRPLGEASVAELEAVDWLLRGRADLWIEVQSSVEDPAWFVHFTEQGLWENRDREWQLSVWCARDWTSRRRLHLAAKTLIEGGTGFAEMLDRHLRAKGPADPPWRRPWRALVATALARLESPSKNDFEMALQLRSHPVFDLDLRAAVANMTPAIVLAPPFNPAPAGQDTVAAPSLQEMFDLSIGRYADDELHAETLAALLERTADYPRLAVLASEALTDTVVLASELDLLTPSDFLDNGLPSVADHPQNQYRGGVLPLIRLVTGVLPNLASTQRQAARGLADSWRALPSGVGIRLWLHAMSLPDLFSIAEVAEGLAGLSREAFWAHHPELPQLLRDRYGGAPEALRQAVVDRIQTEGPLLYADEEAEQDEGLPWADAARRQAMWVRLMALKAVDALTADGEALLAALRTAAPYLDRALEDEDLFSSYSYEVRSVAGDPEPLVAAEPDDRLALAHTLLAGPSFEERHGWSAFCRAQPQAAFDTLSGRAFQDEDAALWRTLLEVLWLPLPEDAAGRPAREGILVQAFEFLDGITASQAGDLGMALVDAFRACPALSQARRGRWWDRLWQACEAEVATDPLAEPDQFYDRVINSAPGKLAEDLLRTMERAKDARGTVGAVHWRRLRRVLASPTRAGVLGRGVCAQAIPYLIHLDDRFVVRHVLPTLTAQTEAGAVLRNVFAVWSRPSPAASRLLKPILLRSAKDLRVGDTAARQIATKLLLPLFRQRLASPPENWGVTDGEVRRALAAGIDGLRIAAALVLSQWQRKPGPDLDPETFWRTAVKSVFQAVWPMEKRCLSTQTSRHLAAVAVAAKGAFPDALGTVGPFLAMETDRFSGLYFLYQSPVARQFPRETLDLLWALLRDQRGNIGSPELAKALDEIMAADPSLEVDRRFQWLEARATRYV